MKKLIQNSTSNKPRDLIDRDKLLKKAKKYSFQTEDGAFPRHDWFIKLEDIWEAPRVED